ncbi:MAG: ABC transporter substrate-binding protein [Chloroflexota bacterium]|nr:ABC transporter substrate-binding protein [Chloroflexota bacterium]
MINGAEQRERMKMSDTTVRPRPLPRRNLLRAGALSGLTFAASPFLAACQSTPPQTTPAETPSFATPSAVRATQRLTLSWWTDIGYPSPFAFIPLGPGGVVRTSLLFDTLIWKDAHGIIPWLAERWGISGDGLDYTFTLRPNVPWHDGQPLTADDVAFSYTYYRAHAFPWGSSDMVASAAVVDARTVRIRLNRPFAPFLENVAGLLPILPKHIWEPVGDPLKFSGPDAVIGSGPFRFGSYKEGTGEYQFDAHAAYFRSRPMVATLRYVLVPLAQGVVGLQTHAADAILAMDYDVVKAFGQGPNYRTLQTPPFSIMRVIFNVDRPPFDQKAFRQAIAYALDRQQIGERVVHGNVTLGNPGVIPPGSPWYNPDVVQYAYDPARARAMLDGLGFRTDASSMRVMPDGQPLAVDFLADPAAADAEIVRLMLKEVGIDVRPITADPKTRTEMMKNRRFGMALTSHIGVGGDPDFLRRWYANQSYNAFEDGNALHNAEFTRLADQQVVEMEVARRKALVNQMQVVLAEELPTLALYHRPFYWLYDPNAFQGWFNTWGGIMDGIPLVDNKIAFLPPA